jgi:hypothetical protein
MEGVINVNFPIAKSLTYDLYKVKLENGWGWREMIIEQNKFWMKNHPQMGETN